MTTKVCRLRLMSVPWSYISYIWGGHVIP